MNVVAYVKEDLKGYTKMIERQDLELQQNATASDAAKACGVPPQEVRLYVINNKVATVDAMLHEGDIVEFYPLISAG